jgi:hypothetical protein
MNRHYKELGTKKCFKLVELEVITKDFWKSRQKLNCRKKKKMEKNLKL